LGSFGACQSVPQERRAATAPKVANGGLPARSQRGNEATRALNQREEIMASDHMVTVTDSNFENEVLKASQPVLIDFWAVWCAPCRAIAPVVDQLAAQYSGKVKVAKINIDENPRIPTQYDVRSIPTLLVFKGGKVVGQLVGVAPKAKIEELVNKAL
jgi:thioredoxin 1